jgi:hypothetical protein
MNTHFHGFIRRRMKNAVLISLKLNRPNSSNGNQVDSWYAVALRRIHLGPLTCGSGLQAGRAGFSPHPHEKGKSAVNYWFRRSFRRSRRSSRRSLLSLLRSLLSRRRSRLSDLILAGLAPFLTSRPNSLRSPLISLRSFRISLLSSLNSRTLRRISRRFALCAIATPVPTEIKLPKNNPRMIFLPFIASSPFALSNTGAPKKFRSAHGKYFQWQRNFFKKFVF